MTSPHFHCFPNLPSELRLKIWALAIPDPRSIEISCERDVIPPGTRRYAKSFKSNIGPPALLHACRESRFEGLLTYKPHFTTAFSTNCIYVDFDRDTIHLSDGIVAYLGAAELKSIQSMVLDVKDVQYFAHFSMDFLKAMSSLRHLELRAGTAVQYQRTRVERRYLDVLTGDFVEAMMQDPEWACPRVSIVSAHTGEEVGVIEWGTWASSEFNT
jgi:hypothetical protein